MARLPQPGGDAGNWGEILNEYLSQAHNPDGSLKNDTVGAPQLKSQSVTSASIADGHVTAAKLASGSVTSGKLAAGTATDGQVLTYNSGNLLWGTVSGGGGPITAASISDSTSIGRAVLTAADAAAVRSAVGAGTSNLTIGTSNTTAKAGDYQPTADQVAETASNKVLTASERIKLAGITTGATANASDSQLRDRTTHTGTQPLSTISDVSATATELNYVSGVTSPIQTQLNAKGNSNLVIGTTSTTAKAGDYQPTADQVTETTNNKVLTAAERTKLAGITSGATANASDAQLRDRATHTGTQALSTISDVTATATELNYSSGVTSAIQAQLNAKGDVIGAASSVLNALPVFNSTSGKLLKSSATTVLTDTGILSTTTATNVQFKGTSTAGGTAGGAGLALYSDNSAVQTSGNRLGFVLFGGASDSAGTLVNSSGIFSYADTTWTSTSAPTRIEFEVAPSGSTTRATALTIKSSGNVGIGVSPSVKLDVNGEARVATAGTNATSVVTVGGTQTLSGKTISGGSNVLSGIAQSSVTNLTTDLSAKTNASTILANGMGVVVHAATAATARPTEFAVVTWIGSVAPTNAAANDIWIYKA